MAVPARKTSKNAKRSRRGGQTPAIHMNENGVYVRNHHVAADGSYKGKQVVSPK